MPSSSTETETIRATPRSSSFGNLDLLVDWPDRRADRRFWIVFAASLFVHLGSFAGFMQLPGSFRNPAPAHVATLNRVKLYLPPDLLTQKAPNRREPTRSIDLASLMSPAEREARKSAPAPSSRHFEVPKTVAPPQAVPRPAPQILAEAPNITASPSAALPAGAMSGLTQSAPPPPSANQPFQNLGSEQPQNVPHQKIAVPNASVQSAVQALSQHSNGTHLVISDDSLSEPSAGLAGGAGQATAPHTEVELQSDPQGADFRAYLAHILTIVRSNWRRVIPESARLGTLRGHTVIQFIINKDGSIPKLVTADESGSDALDRAAVAGLSMSNPLPPLPVEFKGQQVRLAFTFSVDARTR